MGVSVVTVRLQDGSEILAEVEPLEDEFGEAAFGDSLPGEIDFKSALSRVKSAAGELLETIRSMDVQPDDCEVSFGIKLSGELGAIIAKASGEANFTVKLSWSRGAGK